MRKKLLTAVLTAVLCIGGSVTVMAANSPVYPSTGSATATINGQEVTFGQSYSEVLNDAQNQAMGEVFANVSYDENTSDAEIEAMIVNAYVNLVEAQTGMDVQYFGDYGLTYLENTNNVDLSAGVAITFSAPAINAGDNIVVLHLTTAGAWEVIPATAGNGVITGTFTSLSPVFYAEVKTEPLSGTTNNNGIVSAPAGTYDSIAAATATTTTTAAATSPKTGENVMPVALVLAAIALAGGVVIVRRRGMAA